MQPINRRQQQDDIKSNGDLPVIVSVAGDITALNVVLPDRLCAEVKSGAWDAQVKAPHIGPKGRSLLLCLLGSQEGPMQRSGSRSIVPDITELATAMVSRGADPFWKDDEGRDSLDQAFAITNITLLKQWSQTLSPLDMQERRYQNLPWLHKACEASQDDAVEFLLARGLDVNYETDTGQTPLFYAKTPETVERLISAGANSLHRNKDGKDAKVFWANQQDLTQANLQAMAAKLPKIKNAVDRETRVNDFFAASLFAGKTAFVQGMKSSGVKPADRGPDGLGIVGVLGNKFMAAGRDGVKKNKSLSCAEVLSEMPQFLVAASKEDWISLWVGLSCASNTDYAITKLGLLGTEFASSDAFWVSCMEAVVGHTTAQKHRDYRGILNSIASVHKFLPQIEELMPDTSAIARAYVRSSVQIGLGEKGGYGSTLADCKQRVLSFLRKHPQYEKVAGEDAWQLAAIESAGGPSNFSLNLADYLVQRGVRIPGDLLAPLSDLIARCPEDKRSSFAQIEAAVSQQQLQQNTAPSSAPRRSIRF